MILTSAMGVWWVGGACAEWRLISTSAAESPHVLTFTNLLRQNVKYRQHTKCHTVAGVKWTPVNLTCCFNVLMTASELDEDSSQSSSRSSQVSLQGGVERVYAVVRFFAVCFGPRWALVWWAISRSWPDKNELWAPLMTTQEGLFLLLEPACSYMDDYEF